MGETLENQELKLVEELRKMGIYSPEEGVYFLYSDGEAAFRMHDVKLEEMMEFYRSLGDPELDQAMEKEKFYFDALNLLRTAKGSTYHLQQKRYEKDKSFLLYQSTYFSNLPLSSEKITEAFDLFERNGYRKEIKRIRFKKTFDPEVVHQEMLNLYNEIDRQTESIRGKLMVDLEKRISSLLEQHSGISLYETNAVF